METEVILLATPLDANEVVLLSTVDLTGKIPMNYTNPVGPELAHVLKNEISGGEFVQKLVPDAKVVKAFTIYGYKNFKDTGYTGYGALKPAMFIAGNDASAKKTVASLCEELGWEHVDTGEISF